MQRILLNYEATTYGVSLSLRCPFVSLKIHPITGMFLALYQVRNITCAALRATKVIVVLLIQFYVFESEL